MSEIFTSYNVDNDKSFQRAIKRMSRVTSDFRIPFNLIANDFYKSEKAIFQLKSSGFYPDLSPKYKEFKERKYGFAYPILVGKTGRLAASLLSRNAPYSEFFIGKQTLIFGTNVDYAIYHQSDRPRKKIPLRKVLFIDYESVRNAPKGLGGRKARWLAIIYDYMLKVVTKGEA